MFGKSMLFLLSIGVVSTLGLSYSKLEHNPQFVTESVGNVQAAAIDPTPTESVPVAVPSPSPSPTVSVTPSPVATPPVVKATIKPAVAQPTPAPVPIPAVKPVNPKHQQGANDCINKPKPGLSYEEFKVLLNSSFDNKSNPNICNFLQIEKEIGKELSSQYTKRYFEEKNAKK
jgi:hypothetical protein